MFNKKMLCASGFLKRQKIFNWLFVALVATHVLTILFHETQCSIGCWKLILYVGFPLGLVGVCLYLASGGGDRRDLSSGEKSILFAIYLSLMLVLFTLFKFYIGDLIGEMKVQKQINNAKEIVVSATARGEL